MPMLLILGSLALLVVSQAPDRPSGAGARTAPDAPVEGSTVAAPDSSRTRLAEARAARAAGNHERARALVGAAIESACAESVQEPDSATLEHWSELGLAAQTLGLHEPARRIRERALDVARRSLPSDDPRILAAETSLAETLRILGDLSGARASLERALEACEPTIPADDLRLQSARSSLAVILAMQGELAPARDLLDRVVVAYERVLPAEDPLLLGARMNLGVMLDDLGESRRACGLLEEVLAARERSLSPDDPNLQRTRLALASARKGLGDLASAEALQRQALESLTRTLPADHPDVQAARLNLAATRKDLGNHDAARPLEEDVVAVLARRLPADHPHLQVARNNLAVTLRKLGDLQRARILLEQVLETCRRTLPETHPALLAAVENLALVIQDQGDAPGARVLLEQALALRMRTLPDDHVDLQKSRLNLSALLMQLGESEGARSLQLDAQAVYERTLGEDSLLLLRARIALARTMRTSGEPEAACALLTRALDACRGTVPADHPDVLKARIGLAAVNFELGEISRARELEEEVERTYAETLPADHPHLQMVRSNLAWTVSAGMSRFDAPEQADAQRATCRRLLRVAVDGFLVRFTGMLLRSAPREAEEAAVAAQATLDQVLTFALGLGAVGPMPELESLAFTLSETTRAASVRAADWMRCAASEETYGALRARVRSANDELSRLADSGGNRDEFHAAIRERENAQRALADLARTTGCDERLAAAVTPEAVAGALGPEDVVVCYRRFARHELAIESDTQGTSRVETRATDRVCAFVVRRGRAQEERSVVLVDLGSLGELQRLVEAWRGALDGIGVRGLAAAAHAVQEKAALDPPEAAGHALRRRLLDPLSTQVQGAGRVLVVPDDVVCLVPLDALPGEDGRLVGETTRIEVRTSLAEIVKPRERHDLQGLALTLGSARFDAQPLDHDQDPASATLEGTRDDSPARAVGPGFTPLEHTGPEAIGVAELWQRAAGSASAAIILSGASASRSSLVRLAPRARWLHVATHGWHAPDSVQSTEDFARAGGNAPGPLHASAGDVVRGMSPMLLCGLALAGANLPEDAAGRAPGLVTAEEMSALDLSTCELAVLSACDTNVGIRRAGQGVASFQRALQMAGARSVITSLWKVPDEATRELMLDFYRRVWVLKQPKGQALWDAKLAIRTAQDEHGSPKYTTRDWAAWVLTGEPD